MANFDFTTKQQAPDYTQLLQALSDRANAQTPLNAGLGAIAKNLPNVLARAQQKKKQQEVFSQLSQIPELKQLAGPISQNPELLGQLGPALLKPQKPQMEWAPVAGMLSKSGRPLEIDKTSGEIREAGPGGSKSTGYGTNMTDLRQRQYTLQDLPSNQGPNTAAGAAYQVKVAARQGKSLIAKATNPQAISLSSADLGRAVQRSAPLAETIGASNFADNLTTKWNLLTQKLSADPKSKDIPKIRKEIYQMFDELDKAASPWVSQQLDYMDEQGFKISDKTRKKQMGEELPDIPFIDLTGETNLAAAATGSYSDPVKEAKYQAWKKAHGQ